MGSRRITTETGQAGPEIQHGEVTEAYNPRLYWPTVYPLYNRLRRSDPIVSTVRHTFVSLARGLSASWELPHAERASDDDKRSIDFLNESMEDIEGGFNALFEDVLAYTPFMGWGWWELTASVRKRDWRPPNAKTEWRSMFDDGAIGIRKAGFRDHSSFDGWHHDDNNNVLGMKQTRTGGMESVILPVESALHLKFGDNNNPEGLSPLEAIWRLERYAYNLSLIQGIGLEHAAGHAAFKSEKNELTADDQAIVRKAARALLTAQEGNFVLLPKHLSVELVDVPFQAAADLLEAIRFYDILKLAVFGAQWVAFSTLSGTGALAAVADASTMFLNNYNSMNTGLARQLGDQWHSFLRRANPGMFQKITQRPKLLISEVEKDVDLTELNQFVTGAMTVMPIDDDDLRAIRRKSGFLSESLPDPDTEVELDSPEDGPEPAGNDNDGQSSADDETGDGSGDDAGPDGESPEQLAVERIEPKGRPIRTPIETAEDLEDDYPALFSRIAGFSRTNGHDADQLLDAESFSSDVDAAPFSLAEIKTTKLGRTRGGFRFDVSAGDFIYNSNGRTVPASKLVEESRAVQQWAGDNMRRQAQRAAQRRTTLSQFQNQMRRELRDAWRTDYIMGRGGVAQMGPSDWGYLGGKLNSQYRHLDKFAEDVFLGRVTERQMMHRASQFGKSANTAFNRGTTQAKTGAGFTEERRVLNPAEHCADCLNHAAKQWRRIGSLPEPGEESVCRVNCQCQKEYRRR